MVKLFTSITSWSYGIKEKGSCSGILIVSVNHLDFLLFNSEFPVSKMTGLEMLLF